MNVFIATHNAHFLMGVVESGRPLELQPGWDRLRAKQYGRTHVAILERSGLGQM